MWCGGKNSCYNIILRKNGENEKEKIVVAFCEFYKDDIESEDIDEILNSTYNGMKVADIIEELDEKEVDIF